MVELYCLQLPGRGSRWGEAPYARLIPLVQAVASALLPFLDKPFAFFGHSMGSMIGYELARELRKRGAVSPAHFFVSGGPAPHVREKKPPVHGLPDLEFVQHLRKLNGTPPHLLQDEELLDLMLPVLRADFAICETYAYTPEPPLECPISVFGGIRDGEISKDDLESWREHTSGNFFLQMFDGDHFFIQSARAHVLQELSKKLHAILQFCR
jgi:medium-chain acyl-[acyl-carrier-protein] hydrolase